ncbi:hypothetical protein FBBAL38_09249 [Flavobacteria bacterium BAL38]|nr:hypothetical protein FBBAL38_09249 [Flavobacteria bacterium BAL38]
MKRSLIIILALFFCNLYSQDYKKINKVINISDSLAFTKELRIYKNFSTTNGSEVFRIYQLKDKLWRIELYTFFDAITSNEKPKFTLEYLHSASNLNQFWSRILDTHAEFLPDIKDIDYKLKGKTEFESDKDDFGSNRKIAFTDGIGYIAFIRNYDKVNQFSFANAEGYLEYFPDVDELNSYSCLLNLIRTQFNIWKD